MLDEVEYFSQVQAGPWAATLGALLRFAAIPAHSRVVDIGTGPGLLARLLVRSGAPLVVGADRSLAMLHRARTLSSDSGEVAGGLAWLTAEAMHLPFVAGAFDAALATNLLFLLDDPGAALEALVGAVRPGGVVAFLNPSHLMSRGAAESYAATRGLAGFARNSFITYGGLADEHHAMSSERWAGLANAAGLEGVTTETRAGGLIVLARGIRVG